MREFSGCVQLISIIICVSVSAVQRVCPHNMGILRIVYIAYVKLRSFYSLFILSKTYFVAL